MMKEVTVKEFVAALNGETVDVNPLDYFGITIEMAKAKVHYNEERKELSFKAGKDDSNGIATITFEVEKSIEYVVLNEETDTYIVSFEQYMSELAISKSNVE